MRLRRLATIGLLGPALLAQTGILGPSPCAQTMGFPAEIELRTVAVVSQYGWLRKQAEAGSAAASPACVKDAILLLELAARDLQSEEAWNLIAAPLVRCGNSMDYVVAAEQLPEQITLGRLPVKVRENAIRLASALNQTEAHFVAKLWPSEEPKLLAERDRLKGERGKQLSECLPALRKELGLQAGIGAVPIFLVHEFPENGATSMLAAPRFGFSIVSINPRAGSGTRIVESVLHQYAHVLDLAAPEHPSITRGFGAELTANGVPAQGTIWREAVRLLRAIAAADLVTRLVDRKHVAAGETLGWYAASDAIANPIRKLWPEALGGKRPREEVIADMAALIAEKAVSRPSPRPKR